MSNYNSRDAYCTHLDTVDAVLVGRARAIQQLWVQLPVRCEELKPHRLLVPADEEVHRRSREVSEHLWSRWRRGDGDEAKMIFMYSVFSGRRKS